MKNKKLTHLWLLALILAVLACRTPIDLKLKPPATLLPALEEEPSEVSTGSTSEGMPTAEETSEPELGLTPSSHLSELLSPAPSSASMTIYKLAMFTQARGWAVTQDQNYLLVTEDGGETWLNATPSEMSTPPGDFTTHGIRPFFLDENTAWFTPYSDGSSQIYHTINGGINWEHADVPFENVVYTFIDQEIGYGLVSLDAGAGSFYVAIYQTLNGGSSWTLVFTHEPGVSKSLRESGTKSGITFLDVNHGWIGGAIPMDDYFYLFYTEDGGVTWAEEGDISLPVDFSGSMLDVGQPQFIDAATAFLPVKAYTPANMSFVLLYRSLDSGDSWQFQGSVLDGQSVDFYSAEEGWLASKTTLYHTLDGGETLTALTPLGIPEDEVFIQVDFVDSSHGWVLTTPDEMSMSPIHLYGTADGGLNWRWLNP